MMMLILKKKLIAKSYRETQNSVERILVKYRTFSDHEKMEVKMTVTNVITGERLIILEN